MKKVLIALSAIALLAAGAAMPAGAEMIRSGSFVTDHAMSPGFYGTPHGVRSNILVNPGFESGTLAPWTTAGWTVITSDTHTGEFAAQGITNIWIRQDITPTDVTTINSISVWEKQPSGIAFAAVDFIYTGEDYDEFLVAPGADWTFIDMTSQLRGSGNLIAIRFWSYSGGGDQITRIDDAVIDTEGATPTETSSWSQIKALYR